MSDVLAIIPARAGSKGIPGKNFRRINGTAQNITSLAVGCALAAGVPVVVTSDADPVGPAWACLMASGCWIQRPPELATDSTPMLDVIRHVLEQIPGPEDQICLLIQPTQPLRKPEHLLKALEMMRDHRYGQQGTVVSITAVPETYHPAWGCWIDELSGRVIPYDPIRGMAAEKRWWQIPTRRQDIKGTFYVRDGTVYAFRRSTVTTEGNIYGYYPLPLIIHPEETCPLDTMADWAEAERRLRA